MGVLYDICECACQPVMTNNEACVSCDTATVKETTFISTTIDLITTFIDDDNVQKTYISIIECQ